MTPEWIRKRDGRLVPFDADRICQALFSAGEETGEADPFLARELTDGVVHFLAGECEGGAVPTTEQVRDVVVKVVRELGQPHLAEAFAPHGRTSKAREIAIRLPFDTPADDALAGCMRDYTLQAVYSRDLAAAHAAGLLTLTDLHAPGRLTACVVGPGVHQRHAADDPAALIDVLGATAGVAGEAVIDGPDHALAGGGRSPDEAKVWVGTLSTCARATGSRVAINLNAASPPPWSEDLAAGPLFGGRRLPDTELDRRAIAEALRDGLLSARPGPVRVVWHLSDRDFDGDARPALDRVVAAALEGADLTFALDRPRRPVALAAGLERPHPAILGVVGIHLPRLSEQPGVGRDPSRFLGKLGSLARLALSAGSQKRAFLRRQEQTRAALQAGFLLDRARLVVAPVGLDAVSYQFTGEGLSAGGAGLDFGRRVVERLAEVLRADGREARMPVTLDGPDTFRLSDPSDSEAGTGDTLAGLTSWGPGAPPRAQGQAGDVLHAAAGAGCLALYLSDDAIPRLEKTADLLRTLLRQTEVRRVRLLRTASAVSQLVFAQVG